MAPVMVQQDSVRHRHVYRRCGGTPQDSVWDTGTYIAPVVAHRRTRCGTQGRISPLWWHTGGLGVGHRDGAPGHRIAWCAIQRRSKGGPIHIDNADANQYVRDALSIMATHAAGLGAAYGDGCRYFGTPMTRFCIHSSCRNSGSQQYRDAANGADDHTRICEGP
jgi:hypothetical protein